jgi:hypothetical protein
MPAFAALLKLVPLKDWLYIGLISAILAFFGWYTVHERNIGHAAAVAAEQKATAKEEARVQEVQKTAQESINGIEKAYNAAIASAPTDSPHIIVRNSPAGSGDLCEVAVTASKSDGASDLSKAVPGVDIGPADDKLHADADAQITGLQAIIKSYQAETK